MIKPKRIDWIWLVVYCDISLCLWFIKENDKCVLELDNKVIDFEAEWNIWTIEHREGDRLFAPIVYDCLSLASQQIITFNRKKKREAKNSENKILTQTQANL